MRIFYRDFQTWSYWSVCIYELTLQSFGSRLFPVGLIAVEDGGSDGLEFVVSDIKAEVDDVSEHFVETIW